jgi:hypothetical protein
MNFNIVYRVQFMGMLMIYPQKFYIPCWNDSLVTAIKQ